MRQREMAESLRPMISESAVLPPSRSMIRSCRIAADDRPDLYAMQAGLLLARERERHTIGSEAGNRRRDTA